MIGFVVGALLVVQIGMGVVTAHYGVEGSGFYGLPLDQVLAMGWFKVGLLTGHSFRAEGPDEPAGQVREVHEPAGVS